MSSSEYRNHILLAATVMVLAGAMSAAQADEEGHHRGKYGGENRGKPLQSAQANATYQTECSSCHVAYAPGLLPADSWRKVMAGLDKHFGTDASLSEPETREITAFLVNNASNRWSAPTAPLRITESAWFRHKHGEDEIAPGVWKRASVKSPANCSACHPRADRGDFDEDGIRIPK